MSLLTLTSLGVWRVVEERNQALESTRLLLTSSDPRKLDAMKSFERRADEAYNKNSYMSSDYFEELIMWGDAYFGKGIDDKAIKFFQKARSLYPKKDSHKHLLATSKLAQAHAVNNIFKAEEIISPYLKGVTLDANFNPDLLNMLLLLADINERYYSYVFADIDSVDVTKFITEIAKTKPFANISMDSEIALQYASAKSLYYTLESDMETVTAYVTKDEYENNVLPTLKESKRMLEGALDILRNSSSASYREPDINGLLGYMYAEMQEYALAQTFLNLSIEQYQKIYGPNHITVIAALLKYYAAFRYYAPEFALQKIETAYEIAKTPDNENKNTAALARGKYLSQLIVVGDYQNAYKKIHELLDGVEIKIENFVELVTVTSGVFDSLWLASFMDESFEGILDKLFVLESAYNEFDPGEGTLDLIVLLKSRYQNDDEAQYKLIQAYEKAHFSDLDGIGYSDAAYVLEDFLHIAELCLKNKYCDPEKYLKQEEELASWSHIDDKQSSDKLQLYYRKAKIYYELGQYSKANALLDEVHPILLKLKSSDSLHHAAWFNIKGRVLLSLHKETEGIEHLRKALDISVSQFGSNANYTADIRRFIYNYKTKPIH